MSGFSTPSWAARSPRENSSLPSAWAASTMSAEVIASLICVAAFLRCQRRTVAGERMSGSARKEGGPMSETNRRLVLAERPTGNVDESTVRLEEEDAPEPGDGEALVRNRFLSIDPTIRTWMDDAPGSPPPV